MRSAAGLTVAVVAVLLLAVGAWAALAPGGNEPEAIRSLGVTMLVLGTLAGIGAAMILRSRS
jgi:hypothetical protein